jgi:hypothetical protein
LKDEIETEIPFNDAPNSGKNERIASSLKKFQNQKVGSIKIQQHS